MMLAAILSSFQFRLLLLREQVLPLLLLNYVRMRVQRHRLGAVSIRQSLPKRLRVYPIARGIRHWWRADQEMWGQSQGVCHLRLIKSHPMLPLHHAMIPTCWCVSLSVIAS